MRRFVFTILLVLYATLLAAQDHSQSVELELSRTKTVRIAGITNVQVLDEDICSARILPNGIELTGLLRGSTVVFAWAGEQRVSIVVDVVPAVPAQSASLQAIASEENAGFGTIGSHAQIALSSQGQPLYSMVHRMDWIQQAGERRLVMRGQVQDVLSASVAPINLSTLSIQYFTPRATYNLVDYALNVNGGTQSQIAPYSPTNTYVFRGADVLLNRGKNEIEAFGGMTMPGYFLSFNRRNKLAGLNLNRRQSEKLFLYSTAGGLRSGVDGRLSFFQTAGLAYRLTHKWSTQATIGGSNRGALVHGTVAFNGERLTTYVSGTSSSREFPLNQLQLLFAGNKSVLASVAYRASHRMTTSVSYQSSSSAPFGNFSSVPTTGSYLNPNVSVIVSPSQTLTLNYVHSHTTGGVLGGDALDRRAGLGLNSQLPRHVSLNSQLTWNDRNDRRQFNAHSEFGVKEFITVPTQFGIINAGLSHNRMNSEVAPTGLLLSQNLPADAPLILERLQPVQTDVGISGQFRINNKFHIAPSFSVMRNTAAPGHRSDTKNAGYTLMYQATPTLQILSSVANTLVFDSRNQNAVRATGFTVGINKQIKGAGPRWLMPSIHEQVIEGTVFVDANINGILDPTESGLSGITVALDNGQRIITGSDGHFLFTGLNRGHYRVSVALQQFRGPVRMTTSNDVDVVLPAQDRVHFGVVNFARLIGNVFNDYVQDGERHTDAPGLRNVTLVISSAGGERRTTTNSVGDYEIDDLPPGEYTVSVDPATLPPNYVFAADAVPFQIRPTATVVKDVPVRALRSIAGHVYLRRSSEEGEPARQPLSGVQIAANHISVTTDGEGRFVLHDLPAGDFRVTLVPAKPVPEGLQVPSGVVRLPKDPTDVQEAVIVISNSALADYLLQ